jgi:hypothetical protein
MHMQVVLRVVRVFPHEEGFCCVGDVDAIEEEADSTGCRESFVWALFGQLQGEIFEA